MAKNNKDSSEETKKGKAKNSSNEPKKQTAVSRYFKDLKAEFSNVVWPSKEQITNNSAVVLVTIVVVGLFVFGLDSGFSALLKLLLEH